MAVAEARAMVVGAFQDLNLRWRETKAEWRDAQAQRFEDTFMYPLSQDVKAAATAMEQLAKAIGQCRRDCE